LQQDIANRQRSTLEVDLDDLDGFSKDPELVEHLEHNTQQYLVLLAEAADNIMPSATDENLPEDVFDVLLDQVSRRSSSPGGSGSLQCIEAERFT
jgi:DNA replicative helicase MCM subunit Mcm2 (Cdc46/Mcm family)